MKTLFVLFVLAFPVLASDTEDLLLALLGVGIGTGVIPCLAVLIIVGMFVGLFRVGKTTVQNIRLPAKSPAQTREEYWDALEARNGDCFHG